MKSIILQAGHLNCKSNCVVALRGSTGAAGEVQINQAVRDETARILIEKGHNVLEVDSNYNCDPSSLDKDWDLFLAIHCDMNYANDQGSGFCDYPEPSTDDATEESQRCAKAIQDYFFPKVGIKVVSKSNKNTRYYYMWQSISAKTPCVLIEMGQVQDEHDYPILKDTKKVSSALAESILSALEEDIPSTCEDRVESLERELDEMRESRNKWRTKYEELDKSSVKELQEKIKHIEELQKTIAEQNSQLSVASANYDSYNKEIELLREENNEWKEEKETLTESLEEANKENERLANKLKSITKNRYCLVCRFLDFVKGGASK